MIIKRFFFMCGFFIFLTFPAFDRVYAESITVTTHYPAPFGAYDRLRLVPRGDMIGSCDPGTLYVKSSDGSLQFCGSTGIWGFPTGAWQQTGNNLYPTDYANPNLKVGIGITNPGTALQVGTPIEPINTDRKILIQGGINSYTSLKFSEAEPGASREHGFQFQYDGQANDLNLLFGTVPNFATGSDYPNLAFSIFRGPTDNSGGGNIGIGVKGAKNKLDVKGSMAIGNAYAGVNTAPLNGLIVEGNVGIKTASPSASAALEVNGNVRLSGASATYKISNVADPIANQDVATKAYVDAAAVGGCFNRFCGIASFYPTPTISCIPPACPAGSTDQGFVDCYLVGGEGTAGHDFDFYNCTRACCQ